VKRENSFLEVIQGERERAAKKSARKIGEELFRVKN
jgi:hypothetical protein